MQRRVATLEHKFESDRVKEEHNTLRVVFWMRLIMAVIIDFIWQ